MHTIELLEHAQRAAKQLGLRVRQELLSGPGGLCEYGGERWLFVDLAASPAEQLATFVEALAGQAEWQQLKIVPELRQRLSIRRAA